MSNAALIALTALRVFERKSDVIANNIANVNTEEELIALSVNKFHYEANLKTVETTAEMQGTLFDILG